MFFLLSSLSLLGCDVDEKDPAFDCAKESLTWPAEEETVWTESTITMWLDEADPTASIWVEGVPGTSTIGDDPRQILFVPNEPLAHDTEYELGAEWCESEKGLSHSFNTGPGVSPESLELPITFYPALMPLSSSRILNTWAGPYLSLDSRIIGPMLHIQSAEGGALTMSSWAPFADEGSTCDTFQSFEGTYENGNISFSGDSLYLNLLADGPDVEQVMEDFTIQGSISEDNLIWGELTGRLNVQDLEWYVLFAFEWFGEDSREGKTICEVSSEYGTDCVACSDGVVGCLDLQIAFAPVEESDPYLDFTEEPTLPECFTE